MALRSTPSSWPPLRWPCSSPHCTCRHTDAAYPAAHQGGKTCGVLRNSCWQLTLQLGLCCWWLTRTITSCGKLKTVTCPLSAHTTADLALLLLLVNYRYGDEHDSAPAHCIGCRFCQRHALRCEQIHRADSE